MSIKKAKNSKIKYGDKDLLTEHDLKSENIRHRISIVIPEDVLMNLREEAKKLGLGYQTLINQILRRHVTGQETLEERVTLLEAKLLKEA